MSDYDFDLFVIGAGSGGVRAARMAANFGARVAVCEERQLGGTCVNVGCVPKKLLVYGSHFESDLADAAGYGWTFDGIQFDWQTWVNNKNREITRLNTIYGRLLDNARVQRIVGRGHITSPHEVEVAGQRYSAERILIATGGWPMRPPIPGKELGITSNEVFSLDALPKRALIVGAGYIGVEFAGIFNSLGVDVTLVHRDALPLRGFDKDIREQTVINLRNRGVDLHLPYSVDQLTQTSEGIQAHLTDDVTVDVDLVLFAVGRQPLTQNLGLEEVGVQCDDFGAIVVNDDFRTSVASIYALGDVIDRSNLTPVAIAQAMHLVHHLYGPHQPAHPFSYANIATAVFSQPPAAAVGLTEEQARARGDITVYRSIFRPMKHTLSGRDEKTMMKLIVSTHDDRVVGCHMVGPNAGEIIQGLAIALQCGATKAQFDATVGIHPTAAEEFVTMRTPVS